MKILYKEYTKLKLRKILGFKSFKTNIGTIATKDGIITIGCEYQYKEGSCLERVIIENIDFRDFYLEVKLNFFEQKRRIKCTHRYVDAGYSGMWRLWDKGKYDIEEWRRDMEIPRDYSHLDNLPVIEINTVRSKAEK